MADFNNLVDKSYRGKSAEELLKAPVSALRGVSKDDEEKLVRALGIRTIGDLASHWSVKSAQAIVASRRAGSVALASHAILAETSPPDDTDAMKDIEALLKGGDGSLSLQGAWIGLQVYSYFGLHLPSEDDTLRLALNTDKLGEFTFVPPMKEAYSALKSTSRDFLNNVYNKIVDLGQHLKDFASDATDPDGIFSSILRLVDKDDVQSALELLQDRIEKAKANAEAAEAIRHTLTEYKTALSEGAGKLRTVKDKIDADAATSQATIDKLSGGNDVIGSFKNLTKRLHEAQDRYTQDVTIAATTPTYAWVNIPPIFGGLIAAVVVAGVFGAKATEELKNIKELESLINQATEELQRAVAVHSVDNRAHASVEKTLQYTNTALNYASALQRSWQTIKSNLDRIAESLSKTVGQKDGEAALKAKAVVKQYVNMSSKSWADLKPLIDTLMANAYIVVKPGETKWDDLLKEVQEAVAKQ